MSRTARRPRRVRTSTIALVAGVSLALSGCAAGQYSQTADQVAAIDGANGTIGDVAILNARLAPTKSEDYPAGSDARLLLWISNDGLKADTLNQITTSAADSVEIDGDTAEVPGQTLADFATDAGVEVIVTGFTEDLYYGVSIPMTFSFANAGTLDLNIPIQLPLTRSTDRETIEILPPHPTPIWEEGSHGEEGAHSEEGEAAGAEHGESSGEATVTQTSGAEG